MGCASSAAASSNQRPAAEAGEKAGHRPLVSENPGDAARTAPVPSIVYENWAGVDMMYHLDGRRRRQSLVYFGEPEDSSANVAGGAFREARGYVPGPLL